MASDESAEAETSDAPAAPSAAVSLEAVADAGADVAANSRAAITEPPAEPASKPAKPKRFASSVSLGFSLANAGFLPRASLAIAALTTIGAVVVAFALSREDSPPLASLPGVTASALAWGAGFLFAVAASARAFDHDETAGIRLLARARGVSLGTYAIGRVLGLAIVLALIVGVGSLITGGVCAALAHGSKMIVGRATLATLVYSLSFGLLVAPLAAATLGARSRGQGYLILIGLLVIPEGLQDSLDSLPERWRGLFGIPSAMGALRDSLSLGHLDLPLAGAAGAVIVLVSFVAMVFSIEQALRAARAQGKR